MELLHLGEWVLAFTVGLVVGVLGSLVLVYHRLRAAARKARGLPRQQRRARERRLEKIRNRSLDRRVGGG